MNKSIKNEKSAMRPPMSGPGHMMGRGAVEKSKNFKGTLSKLAQYMKSYWISIILAFTFAIASTIFAIISPKILGNVTDQVVEEYIEMKMYDSIVENLPEGAEIPEKATGTDVVQYFPPEILEKFSENQLEKVQNLDLSNRPFIDFKSIIKTVYLLTGLYILSMLFGYAQGWIMTNITQKVTYTLRKEVAEKIYRLPLRYFDTRTHGEILSRIVNDIDTVGQTLNQSLSQVVTSVTTIIGILVMMISISEIMTLVSILAVPLGLFVIKTTIKKSQPLFKKQQKSLGEINGHVEEMYAGHSIVKVFGGTKKSIEKFNRINRQIYSSAWKSSFLSGLMMPVMAFTNNLGYVAVSVLGGWYASKGQISIGDIQALLQYLQQISRPIKQTTNNANIIQSTVASAERVFEFLEEEEERKEAENVIVIDDIKGNIKFNNIFFSYDKKETVINGFTAKIKPGQRIAIVGPTGAGKTTIINLLMRFYDVDEGSIEIDGVDIRKLRRTDLRKMFGMVLQDTWLFNGTIRDNLLYSKPDATEREMVTASKAAHADRFIQTLPKGYDMVISEEMDNLSLGEKQILTIARAMIANPPMLILDEATSSVDTRTEVAIQIAMDNLMQNRTSFVIAHRLSTIKSADLILVMDKGNIVEQGTHEELLANKGFYENLYNSQFSNVVN